jgi:hypothetical protein
MGEMWDDLLCQRIANETNKDNFFQQIKRAKENISFLKKTIDTDKRRFKKEEKTQSQLKDQVRELEMSQYKIDKQVRNIKSKIKRYTEIVSFFDIGCDVFRKVRLRMIRLFWSIRRNRLMKASKKKI